MSDETSIWRPPIARRISEARASVGLAPAELAALVGINVESYLDLETYDDEAFLCLSLLQFCALADALQVSARRLVSDDNAPPTAATLTVGEIVAALRGRLVAMSGDIESLSDQLGWDVAHALEEPATIWEEWCVDGLRDVCEPLGLEWLGLLPHREVQDSLADDGV
jgi:hypothetical protein